MQTTDQDTSQVGTKSALSRHQVEILIRCNDPTALLSLMEMAKRSDRTKYRHQVLNPLLNANLVEMTLPDKPTSRLQKYRLTDLGRSYLAQLEQRHES